MAFNKVNHAKNLPDTYRKDVDSNNYKILEIERSAVEVLNTMLSEIYGILDLDTATGATLDLYGEKIGQKRGSATDAQYRIMLKAKAARNLVNGSYQSICDALCVTFSCDKSELCFEDTDTPCHIEATTFPIVPIAEAGFTPSQAMAIVKSLLPVCVTLEPIFIEGSFMFSDVENDMDENAGFTDVEGGTVGGIFGSVYGTTDDIVLPI